MDQVETNETSVERSMILLEVGLHFAVIVDGDEALRFGHQRPDGAQVFADDLHLVQLNSKSADLLLQVVTALTPLLRIRVQFTAAVDLLR